MIFKELVLENYSSYVGRNVIDLRPQNDDQSRPIILFGGMNGGGKTSLLDAIRLAFYGHRAQCSNRGNLSYSQFLSQSVHNKLSHLDDPKTTIELCFEHIRDNQWVEIRIVRMWTIKPKDGKDILDIRVDGWTDKSITETWDEYVEQIFPLGISNLFLFDGEEVVKELAEQDKPPEPVFKAIQTLLGLELSEKLAEDLEILVKRKRKAIASYADLASIDEIEAKLNGLNATKERNSENLLVLQNDLDLAHKNAQNALTNFRLEGGKIASQRSRLDEQQDSLTKALEEQRKTLRNLASETLPLSLITDLLYAGEMQTHQEVKSQQAKTAQHLLAEKNQRLLTYLSELALTTEQLHKIEDFLDQESLSLSHDTSANWLEAKDEELKQLNIVLGYELPAVIKQTQECLAKVQQLEQEINVIERQLAIAASPEAYEKLETQLKKTQQEVKKAEKAYEEGKQACEQIDREIVKVKKELEKYTEQALERQNSLHIIESVGKVKKTLEIFRDRLTLKKLNKLETEITECFRYLLHKTDLVHRVTIDSNTFAISLYDLNGNQLPKQRLSAGEKQLLAIAFLWGLARVSRRNLPIAIDTPLSRLDSEHRHNLVERYFPAASHQVIILSTDTEIGVTEVQLLRQQEAIALEYLIKYDSSRSQSSIERGYFW